MKIGIESKGFDEWGGGIDFIRHVASCIELADSENQYEKHILLSKNDSMFYLKKVLFPFRFIVAQIIRRKPLFWQTWKGFDENYLRYTFSDFQSYALVSPGFTFSSHLKYAQRNKFDILLPCKSPPSSDYALTWIGYLSDFQQRYLPQFFTEKEIAERDCAFASMLHQANHVIVNAKSVKSDAEKFVVNIKAKIHVLPFSPSPRLEWLNEVRDLREKFGIEKPYFIISNQFWIHKDHVTAFKGFAELLQMVGEKYQLVCTGDTLDDRFPGYYNTLLDLIGQLGIRDNVRILGHIPKLDQIALLKKSIAVIQPTLFEGGPGGGASYDAISLGKPLIISDIPVNQEIDEDERVFFFSVKNAKSLAEKMIEVANMNFTSFTNEELYARGLIRKKACGAVLLEVIKQALR